MFNRQTNKAGWAALAVAAALAGCSSGVKLDPAIQGLGANGAAAQAGAGAYGSGVGAGGVGAVTPVQAEQVGAGGAGPVGVGKVVYFDFDSFTVKPEYQSVVDQHARHLQANRGQSVSLEGHTDERGSREYNLALGQKRAEAVRRAMTLMGAADAQIEAVSFGEEKPSALGAGESAYSQNRRVEIRYR